MEVDILAMLSDGLCVTPQSGSTVHDLTLEDESFRLGQDEP